MTTHYAGVAWADGLAAVAGRLDALLVDQFGVLHDGVRPYPGVVAALEAIARAGLPVVVLTNSGKPAAASMARLERLGVPARLITAIVSSGDVAQQAIASGTLGAPFAAGGTAFVVGREGDDYGLGAIGLRFADAPEAADFLLILGSNAPETTLDDYSVRLAAAARAGIPALCANPDKSLITPEGLMWGAGAIADRYAALGGPVLWVGKPYGRIFRAALAVVPGATAARTMLVGDSVEHDIRGGRGAGIATALVRTGILADRDEAGLAAVFAELGATPDVILPAFRW